MVHKAAPPQLAAGSPKQGPEAMHSIQPSYPRAEMPQQLAPAGKLPERKASRHWLAFWLILMLAALIAALVWWMA